MRLFFNILSNNNLLLTEREGRTGNIGPRTWQYGPSAARSVRKRPRIGPFPWKRSVLQNPDRERTNQSTGICRILGLPYNNDNYQKHKPFIRGRIPKDPILVQPFQVLLQRHRALTSGTNWKNRIAIACVSLCFGLLLCPRFWTSGFTSSVSSGIFFAQSRNQR